jgi:hypothetical protein
VFILTSDFPILRGAEDLHRLCPIYKGCDDATQVATADVHGDPDTSLQTSSNVVAIPGDSHRDQWVDTFGESVNVNYFNLATWTPTASSKENASVLDTRLVRSKQQRKSNNSHQFEGYHEDASLFELICCIACKNSEDTSDYVGRDSHELRMLRRVAHVLDDGRKKQ